MTPEEKFAKEMSDLLYEMQVESPSFFFDHIPDEYVEKMVNDPKHSEIMHKRMYDNILEDVTNYPDRFLESRHDGFYEKKEYRYNSDMWDYTSAMDDYIQTEFEKERQARLQIKYKIWVEVERIEYDPLKDEEEYFDEDNPLSIAYRDTLESAVELQNDIEDAFGELPTIRNVNFKFHGKKE